MGLGMTLGPDGRYKSSTSLPNNWTRWEKIKFWSLLVSLVTLGWIDSQFDRFRK